MSEKKVIILTGASRGIGLAIAKELLKNGHKLVLVARTKEPLEKLKDEYAGTVEVCTGDLNDFEVCLWVFCWVFDWVVKAWSVKWFLKERDVQVALSLQPGKRWWIEHLGSE